MPLVEKHGGLWLDDPGDIRTQPLFEHFDATAGLLGIVVRSPSGHFTAAIFEKSYDPQWRLPFWSERRPGGLFSVEADAVAHIKALLRTASGA